jgi:hypothetical protein
MKAQLNGARHRINTVSAAMIASPMKAAPIDTGINENSVEAADLYRPAIFSFPLPCTASHTIGT